MRQPPMIESSIISAPKALPFTVKCRSIDRTAGPETSLIVQPTSLTESHRIQLSVRNARARLSICAAVLRLARIRRMRIALSETP